MPELCRFYGIIIGMFYDDHPPPHFHVRYAEFEAVMRIDNFTLTEGRLPPRALGLVVEWAAIHQTELLRNWKAVALGRRIRKIAPLE